MVRIKQTKKGWVSINKLPSGKWITAAFLERKIEPIQRFSNTRAIAMKIAILMIKKFL